jgi:hypothetical protein
MSFQQGWKYALGDMPVDTFPDHNHWRCAFADKTIANARDVEQQRSRSQISASSAICDLGSAIRRRFVELGGIDLPSATREPIRAALEFGEV